jgi:integrase
MTAALKGVGSLDDDTAVALAGVDMHEEYEGMSRPHLTVHGFRSTFRDWAAEQTSFPREIAERALAHALKDKTEAAYQRGDLLKRRRLLMNAWAEFCSRTAQAKVVSLLRTQGRRKQGS